MAEVEDVLKRLKREFVKVNLLQASLDALIAYLTVNLVLFLFGISIFPEVSNASVLAFLALGFFFADLAYRARNYRLEIYEERNPELQEILRTARDNPEQETFVERAMVQDLLKRLQSVTSDSIIPSRTLIEKITVVGALSFLTLLSGVTSFQLQDPGGSLLPSLQPGDDGRERVLRNGSQIYGERSDIDASDLDLGFNITGEGERERGDAGSEVFQAADDAALEAAEKQLSEDLVLAKRYSVAVKDLQQQ